MKPICVPCQRFYRVLRTGYSFVEGMPIDNQVRPGKEEPEKWKPYKLWHGDLWVCEGCGHLTISGVGRAPIAEHYQPEFADAVAKMKATLQINDC